MPKNLPNFGTMNGAAERVGNWIKPKILLMPKKTVSKFLLTSWEIVAKADELELFEVRFH